MQETFYKDVICNPKSNHRYWGLWQDLIGGWQYIGMGGITNIEWENSIGEISLILNPHYVGKGFGKQAVELLLDQAFSYMGLRTVYGECYQCNSAIKFWDKIIKKYSAYQTTLPKRKFWDGKYYGSLYFSIARDGFREVNCED